LRCLVFERCGSSTGSPTVIGRIMRRIHIAEERGSYLLLADACRFAIVERRNGKFYTLNRGERAPIPMTEAGAMAAVGSNWHEERTARRVFDEIVARYGDLAERLR
jgi:hypothetical protein